MRILPGQPATVSNESITSRHLMQFAVSKPEILPQVATLFKNEQSALTSMLASRNLISGNLYDPTNKKSRKYRTVGNRQVKWRQRGLENRKGVLTRDAVCEAYSTEMGKHQSIIYLYLNTNWFSPKDVLELADNRTLVYNADVFVPEEVSGGEWLYKVKLNTNDPEEYVNENLLKEGEEVGFAYTAFEEMSETAYEKYVGDQWAKTFMTIQRMKWSISGTAEAMKADKIWIEHRGQYTYVTEAEMQMLRRWASALDYQILQGKGTVTSKDEVVLKDIRGNDIMQGDGILNQGDGSLRFGYRNLTKNVLHNVMQNMQILSSNERGGVMEVGVLCGQAANWDFTDLMAKTFNVNPVTVTEGSGDKKGLNYDFSYYQYGGVRFYPIHYKFFDNHARPTKTLSDGTTPESRRMVFFSMGDLNVNEPQIELLTLGKRNFIQGEVTGMNEGGRMSNSVDGKSKHVLAETGVARIDPWGVAELYYQTKY